MRTHHDSDCEESLTNGNSPDSQISSQTAGNFQWLLSVVRRENYGHLSKAMFNSPKGDTQG